MFWDDCSVDSAHNDMAFWKTWKEEVWFGAKEEEDDSVQQPKKKKKKKTKTKNTKQGDHDDETLDDNPPKLSKQFKFIPTAKPEMSI